MNALKVAGVFLLLSCGTPPELESQIVKSDELPADTLIVLQRGACERRCAVYNVILFADGSAIFDGRHYVGKPGLAKTSVSRDVVAGLLDQAKQMRFFDLPERVTPESAKGCDASRSDAPAATVTVGANGRAKTVVHHLSCGSGEWAPLVRLEEAIDKAVNAARWVR